MENKYFPGVEFPEPEEETPESQPEGKEKLEGRIDEALTDVRRMINAIRTGESDIYRGALMINDNTPMMASLGRLETTPSKGNLREFLSLVKQDINMRAAREFAKIFQHNDKDLKKLLEEQGVL